MAEYQNTGVIFRNEKKNDKAPEYKGKGNFDGKAFEIACWVKKDKNGKSYFSVSFKEPYKKDETIPGNPPDKQTNVPREPMLDDPNNDLPF